MKIGPGRAPRCNRFPAQSLGIGAMAHLRSPVKGANRTRWVVPFGLLSSGWKAAGSPAITGWRPLRAQGEPQWGAQVGALGGIAGEGRDRKPDNQVFGRADPSRFSI